MIDPKRIAELKALATRDAEVRADPGRFRWTVQTEWQAQYSAAAREAVPALIADNEALRSMLRKCEEADGDDGIPCYDCKGAPGYRHAHDCPRAARLGIVNVPGRVNCIEPQPDP